MNKHGLSAAVPNGAELRTALEASYRLLSPFADTQRWEFDNNLFHLRFLTSRVPRNARILDMGCGIGILDLALLVLGYQVVGIDKYVFASTTAYAVRDLTRLEAIWRGEGLSITSGDALGRQAPVLFDVVVSVAVIEHQKDLKKFMTGLLGRLKPGGHLYVATPNVSNFLNRLRFLFGRAPLGNIREFYEHGEQFTGHWREYTAAELAVIARMAGMRNIEAGNAQSLKPYWTRNWRKWHRLAARFFGGIFPGCGDTDYLWAQK